ncbi:MAG: hypothetical protein WCP34_17055, partial [Pseudomonadota bacterium]
DRHAANRRMSLELIALRNRRNVIATMIEANPKAFALLCVVFYMSFSFWHWWLASPETHYVSAPLRNALRGIGW